MEVRLIPFDVADDSYLYLHLVLSISVNAVADVPDNDVRRRAGSAQLPCCSGLVLSRVSPCLKEARAGFRLTSLISVITRCRRRLKPSMVALADC